jgi:hypothetical protein
MMPREDPNRKATIRFPVLSFGTDGSLLALGSLDRITRCTKQGYKNGFYNGLLLIDADGDEFRVVNAQRVRTLPPKNFGEFLGSISGNPRWQVELEFEPGFSRVSFDEIKRLILNAFEKDRTWDGMPDFETFRDQIATSPSLERVFAVFKTFNLLYS